VAILMCEVSVHQYILGGVHNFVLHKCSPVATKQTIGLVGEGCSPVATEQIVGLVGEGCSPLATEQTVGLVGEG